jgi:2-keto-4-pentenoate hydratase
MQYSMLNNRVLRAHPRGIVQTSKTSYAVAAARLRDAYTFGAVAPLRDCLDPADGTGAYAVQALNTQYWQAHGRRIIGRKIGLTAKAVQAQFGVDQPDYGVLFSDMLLRAEDILPRESVIQPRAEAEVALVLEHGVDAPDARAEDIAAATAYAVAAIEIVDSRISEWKITFADTVADNGSSAFLVLGDQRRPLRNLDLYTCGMVLEINGLPVSVGAGAACLGHPLKAAAWLAQTLARLGDPLRAGDIVMTGALGPMVALRPGDHVVATIAGLGTASFWFASRAPS